MCYAGKDMSFHWGMTAGQPITPPTLPLPRENARKKDVRINNIQAAKAVADAVRTSLGPRGMDKMVPSLYAFMPHRWAIPQLQEGLVEEEEQASSLRATRGAE